MISKPELNPWEPLFETVRGVLADNIRELRGRRQLSQEGLALEAGVDRTLVSKIERVVANPSLEVLSKLSAALNVPVIRLFQERAVASHARH
jgi:transcriptional regulator with XRE-family HTH domain